MKHINVAIDGPSSSGKSTLARRAAAYFGLLYVDTGAIYRCVGLAAKKNGVDPTDAEKVSALLPDVDIRIEYDADGLQRMFLNGEDVTKEIRLHDISMYASLVSAIPQVRKFLFGMQRELAEKHSVIMDGRDIGTVVIPDADVKIFLTAKPEERARRRYLELMEKGTPVDYDTVLKDVIQRDINDTTRAEAPLKAADDAVTIDTTGIDLEHSFELVRGVIADAFDS